MRSAKSFFNFPLLRSALSRAWPLWACYTGIWLILLPLVFFTTVTRGTPGWDAAEQALIASVSGGLFAVFCFAPLFAMQFFSYLTNPRATGGFHSLPLRRETLFLTSYLAGLFCQLLSIALAVSLCTLLAAPYGVTAYLAPLDAFLAPALETVLFYSFAVLCMVMTGQLLAAPIFYLIGNVLAIGMEVLLTSFAGNFLYGYTQGSFRFTFASPIFLFPNFTYVRDIYDTSSEALPSHWIGCQVSNLAGLAVYALVGLVIALAALQIYRKRKSEMTGSTVAIAWAVPIFKYGVAFCTAIAFGQFSYYLFFGQYQSSSDYSLPGTILCMIVSGLLGYYIAEALVKKSFRVLKIGLRGAAIVTIVLVLLGISMTFDLTGYENRVPDATEISDVYYSFSGRTNVSSDDAETIALLTDAHLAIIENKALFLDRADRYYDEDTGRDFRLLISYTLQNGSIVKRYYTITLLKEDLADPTSAASRLNALYLCPDSASSRILPGLDSESDIRPIEGTLSVYYENGSDDYALTAAQAQKIYFALKEDIAHFSESGKTIFSLQEYTTVGDRSYDLTLYVEERISDNKLLDKEDAVDLRGIYLTIDASAPRAFSLIEELLPSLPSLGSNTSVAEPDEEDEVIYVEGTAASVTGVYHG